MPVLDPDSALFDEYDIRQRRDLPVQPSFIAEVVIPRCGREHLDYELRVRDRVFVAVNVLEFSARHGDIRIDIACLRIESHAQLGTTDTARAFGKPDSYLADCVGDDPGIPRRSARHAYDFTENILVLEFRVTV